MINYRKDNILASASHLKAGKHSSYMYPLTNELTYIPTTQSTLQHSKLCWGGDRDEIGGKLIDVLCGEVRSYYYTTS
jgi:hypothetical protein